MVLTKFIVHSTSHQSNQNSSQSLSQNRENLILEMTDELEPSEKFSSKFIRNLCIWRSLSLLKIWSSEPETSCTIEV